MAQEVSNLNGFDLIAKKTDSLSSRFQSTDIHTPDWYSSKYGDNGHVTEIATLADSVSVPSSGGSSATTETGTNSDLRSESVSISETGTTIQYPLSGTVETTWMFAGRDQNESNNNFRWAFMQVFTGDNGVVKVRNASSETNDCPTSWGDWTAVYSTSARSIAPANLVSALSVTNYVVPNHLYVQRTTTSVLGFGGNNNSDYYMLVLTYNLNGGSVYQLVFPANNYEVYTKTYFRRGTLSSNSWSEWQTYSADSADRSSFATNCSYAIVADYTNQYRSGTASRNTTNCNSGYCYWYQLGSLVIVNFYDVVIKTSSSNGTDVLFSGLPTAAQVPGGAWTTMLAHSGTNNYNLRVAIKNGGTTIIKWWNPTSISTTATFNGQLIYTTTMGGSASTTIS